MLTIGETRWQMCGLFILLFRQLRFKNFQNWRLKFHQFGSITAQILLHPYFASEVSETQPFTHPRVAAAGETCYGKGGTEPGPGCSGATTWRKGPKWSVVSRTEEHRKALRMRLVMLTPHPYFAFSSGPPSGVASSPAYATLKDALTPFQRRQRLEKQEREKFFIWFWCWNSFIEI